MSEFYVRDRQKPPNNCEELGIDLGIEKSIEASVVLPIPGTQRCIGGSSQAERIDDPMNSIQLMIRMVQIGPEQSSVSLGDSLWAVTSAAILDARSNLYGDDDAPLLRHISVAALPQDFGYRAGASQAVVHDEAGFGQGH